ncbi:hypothetical protein [Embleya sp. NPDC050493]
MVVVLPVLIAFALFVAAVKALVALSIAFRQGTAGGSEGGRSG